MSAATTETARADTNTSVGVVRQIVAGVLNVGYAEAGDKAAGTDLVRSMAERAEATITEVEGSHVIMLSEPAAVADVILTAAAAVGRPTATAAAR
jgi:hypothetical protein